ncbi:DUF485 domain-containing protein [Bacillus ndiopicus]|uniref:DUF485 domain-containing protein n=1 Tax=Bacillus ndiopicus TaxID=1347368 RepID=UPI0005A64608|nr:DUF485 domain-containing protein [Bacillus ndiopicus]
MGNQQKNIDYDKIAQLDSFKQLVKKKNSFVWTLAIIFLIAYMTLPLLTSYTKILHAKAIGDITWVWIYAAGLFIMTWSLAHLYVAKASTFDKEAKAIIQEYERGNN